MTVKNFTNGTRVTESEHLRSVLEIVNQTTKGREFGRYYEYQFSLSCKLFTFSCPNVS